MEYDYFSSSYVSLAGLSEALSLGFLRLTVFFLSPVGIPCRYSMKPMIALDPS